VAGPKVLEAADQYEVRIADLVVIPLQDAEAQEDRLHLPASLQFSALEERYQLRYPHW
jgi:hypothetical protein